MKGVLQSIKEQIIEDNTFLHLGNFGLFEIPMEVFEIDTLEELVLSNEYWDKEYRKNISEGNPKNPNFIQNIPKEIANLKNLKRLVLSGDRNRTSQKSSKNTKGRIRQWMISDLSPLSELKNLEVLYLSNNKIDDITPLKELTNLRILTLERNYVSDIAPISQLTNLEELYLNANSLTSIEGIKNLVKIKRLDLGYNSGIVDISSLENLENIEYLSLRKTNIGNIKPLLNHIKRDLKVTWEKKGGKGIHLFECPLISPPLEIIKQGNNAIINYFEELENQEGSQIFEAKLLIIGEGGVGKTSLVRKLIDSNATLPKEEDTTKGIDINYIDFKTEEGNKFRIHVWDFGGQEIYHSTHQFFLTKRSLYILVDDTRKDDSKLTDFSFNYWLQVVELLSDNSPIMIVQNEKADRTKEIDLKGMKNKYGCIIDRYKTNLLTVRGLKNIKKAIKYHIQRLPHIGETLPKQWINIRKYLEQYSQKVDFINLEEYLSICKGHGITSEEKALFLSSYLHDLGVFLHFQEDYRLSNLVILNNSWATDAVYKILDDEKIKENFGKFSMTKIREIWSGERYRAKHFELVALMEKFELCYRLSKGGWLAPQLLSVEIPQYELKFINPIKIKFKYEFLPKGLLSRFIVRMNRYIKADKFTWRNGVILERSKSIAEIVETYGKRQIVINVSGRYKKELSTLIIEEFDKMHEQYSHLEYEKLIPCNCQICIDLEEPNFYSYDDLRKRDEVGKETVECKNSYEDVPVRNLIEGILIQEGEEYDTLTLADLKATVFNTNSP